MSLPSSERTAKSFVRYNYDSLNSETFGESATTPEGNWMASHDAFVSGLSDTTSPSTEEEPLSNQIKELWSSSPAQPAVPSDSIWSSPELPSRSASQQPSSVIGSPSLPPTHKVMTLEEIEREYSSPSPPPTETTPSNQPLAPPPGLRMPHPHLIAQRIIGPNPPMRLPPHILLNPSRGLPPGFPPFRLPPRQHLRGFPPPVPFNQGAPGRQPLLPPSAFHRPHPQQRMMAPPHPHWPVQQSELAPRKSRRSEYLGEMRSDGSGFMTQKEKEWVIKIQLIQLQSSDPSNEDYYYMNYMRRKQQKGSNDSTSHTPDALSSQPDDQQILALPNIVHEERKYTPAEFTGALGKLSVLSLGAPRRRMDVAVGGGEAGKEGGMARKKQAFIVIEKLYSVLLNLEEREKKALALSEVDRASLVTHRDRSRVEIMALLQLRPGSSNRSDLALFHQVTAIRKGKRLLQRMLPFLSDDQAKTVLLALLQNMSTIIKKDSVDQVLPELRVCVSAVLSTFDLSVVNDSLRVLLEGGMSSGTGLVRIAQNDFGAHILNELLTRGAVLSTLNDHSNNKREKNDVETWYQWSSQLRRELLAYGDQLVPSSPYTASLLSTLATIGHSI